MVLDAIRGVLESMGPRRVKAERVADLIRRTRGYRWVGLYDVDRDKIAIIGWSGPGAPAYLRFPASKGLSGSAVRTRTTVVVNDVTADPRIPHRIRQHQIGNDRAGLRSSNGERHWHYRRGKRARKRIQG